MKVQARVLEGFQDLNRQKNKLFMWLCVLLKKSFVCVHRGRHKRLESRWGRFGGGDGLPIQSNRAQNRFKPGELLQSFYWEHFYKHGTLKFTKNRSACTDKNPGPARIYNQQARPLLRLLNSLS